MSTDCGTPALWKGLLTESGAEHFSPHQGLTCVWSCPGQENKAPAEPYCWRDEISTCISPLEFLNFMQPWEDPRLP